VRNFVNIVRMGSPKRCLIFCKMRNPSVSPGREKIARGTVCFVVRSLKHERHPRVRGDLRKPLGHHKCVSFAFNHARTAIKTSGWCPPMRKVPIEISRAGCMDFLYVSSNAVHSLCGPAKIATGVKVRQMPAVIVCLRPCGNWRRISPPAFRFLLSCDSARSHPLLVQQSATVDHRPN